ncbi:FAD-dependent oxidoreductase [Bradyrhizobium sp. NP1]|uniref:FAD-dependent oxidoreductase n=1 Tax=Bradyrhizobium sp. NP1 TaxID=3049772 RepID=UPI0025A5C299|nr:FAD-dependent oxidoreductase [Bradyrhizobium sp. NP1]WJR79237.1 FAD-dependent oxidoreductase [Bradyrhizobium sp. NP1]
MSLKHLNYDVAVIGGGAAGIAAAVAAAKSGSKTILVEAGPILGGELLSGMSIDGVLNGRGEWVVRGVADEIFEECRKMDGFIGPLHDYRLICYICVDPEIMKIAVMRVLERYGVTPALYTQVTDVVAQDGVIKSVILTHKNQRTILSAKYFIDASGDGDVAAMAGAPTELSDEKGDLQPLSLMFRMSGVENEPLLRFARDNANSLAVGESEAVRAGRTDEELAQAIYDQGEPTIFFRGNGPFLGAAIQRGEMAATALIMIMPTSKARKEVCVNATRVAENINGINALDVSRVVSRLMEQVWNTANFLKARCPGFENATFAGMAPRVGIRETRRVMGEYVLSADEAAGAVKQRDVITKGAHHIDIHQDGSRQVRIPIADGGSYDIPFGCLIPKKVKNLMTAGRCISTDRTANGTTRMMGQSLGTGHAAGTAAALCIDAGYEDVRQLSVPHLQSTLRSQSAVLEGTH